MTTQPQLSKQIRQKLKEIRNLTDPHLMQKKIIALGNQYSHAPISSGVLIQPGATKLQKLRVKLHASWDREWGLWIAIVIEFGLAIALLITLPAAGWIVYWSGTGLIFVAFFVGLTGTIRAKTWNYILGFANLAIQIIAAMVLKYNI